MIIEKNKKYERGPRREDNRKGKEGGEREKGGEMMYIVRKQRMEASLEGRENLYNHLDDLHPLNKTICKSMNQ